MPPPSGTILKARCKSDIFFGLNEWISTCVGERFLLIKVTDSPYPEYWTLSSDRGIVHWFNNWVDPVGWENVWDVVSWGKM
jgi:hypothetical protein